MTESYIDTETKDVEIKSELIPLVPAEGDMLIETKDDGTIYVQLLDEASIDPEDAKVD